MSWKPYPKISQAPKLRSQVLKTMLIPVNCFNQLITHARSQDLGFRPSTRGFRTWLSWVSGPRYLTLRTWVSGPRKLSILRSSYLFPVTFLCVHRHFSFSRHFSLRPVVTDRRTHGLSEFIYKIH
jgi:hypothetical protein